MLKHVRLPAIAVVLLTGAVVACSSPRSASTGAAPAQTAAAAPGYMVPSGYVSGQRVLPYNGRIQTKCDHMTNEQQRTGCIQMEGGR